MTLKMAIEELKNNFLAMDRNTSQSNYIFYIDKDTNESIILADLNHLDDIPKHLTLGQLASDNFYVSPVSVKYNVSLYKPFNTNTLSIKFNTDNTSAHYDTYNEPINTSFFYHETQTELKCYKIISEKSNLD